jgi:hypothetical protein
MKKYCKNCKFYKYKNMGYFTQVYIKMCFALSEEHIDIDCITGKKDKWNDFIDLEKNNLNEEYNCKYYIRKWYKFWVED